MYVPLIFLNIFILLLFVCLYSFFSFSYYSSLLPYYSSSTLFLFFLFYSSLFFSTPFLLLPFLGAFTKLRKAAISFMSVRPSAWNNSAPTGRIFTKFNIRDFFRKSVGEDWNLITSTLRLLYIYVIFLNSSQNGRCFRQTLGGKIETHILRLSFPPAPSPPKIVRFTR